MLYAIAKYYYYIVFFIGNVFSTKDYSVGQVKGCCYRWKSVGVIVEVSVDCGVGHVGQVVCVCSLVLLWRINCSVRGSCVLHCKVLQLPLYIGWGCGWCGMPGIGLV